MFLSFNVTLLVGYQVQLRSQQAKLGCYLGSPPRTVNKSGSLCSGISLKTERRGTVRVFYIKVLVFVHYS